MPPPVTRSRSRSPPLVFEDGERVDRKRERRSRSRSRDRKQKRFMPAFLQTQLFLKRCLQYQVQCDVYDLEQHHVY